MTAERPTPVGFASVGIGNRLVSPSCLSSALFRTACRLTLSNCFLHIYQRFEIGNDVNLHVLEVHELFPVLVQSKPTLPADSAFIMRPQSTVF